MCPRRCSQPRRCCKLVEDAPLSKGDVPWYERVGRAARKTPVETPPLPRGDDSDLAFAAYLATKKSLLLQEGMCPSVPTSPNGPVACRTRSSSKRGWPHPRVPAPALRHLTCRTRSSFKRGCSRRGLGGTTGSHHRRTRSSFKEGMIPGPGDPWPQTAGPVESAPLGGDVPLTKRCPDLFDLFVERAPLSRGDDPLTAGSGTVADVVVRTRSSSTRG